MLCGRHCIIYLQSLCIYLQNTISSQDKGKDLKLKLEASSRRKDYTEDIFHLDSGFYPEEKGQSLISYLSQSCKNKIPYGMWVYYL